MYLPIERQRFIGLGPEAEQKSDLALAPQLSPEGTANVRVNKDGEFENAKGYEVVTASALTSNGGGDALTCVWLWEYDYGGVRRLVGVFTDGTNETEIWHSTNGGTNWTFLKDLGAGSIAAYPMGAQWKNELYIAFGGSQVVQMYNGTTVVNAGQTQPSAPSVASGAAGTLNGRYGYKVAELDSGGSPGPASAAVFVHLVNEKADLSSISTSGAGGARIFRTPHNSGIFIELTDVSSSTHTDDKSTTDLINEGSEIRQVGDAPPSGAKFPVNHRGRIYYIGDNAEPNGIYPSEIGYPDQVLGNFENIGEGIAGDELSGGYGPYNGELIVAKLKSMWRFLGSGRNSWELVRTEASTGVASHRTIFNVPANSVFRDAKGEFRTIGRASIGYMTPELDIRVFDGVTDGIISWDKQTTLDGYNLAAREAAFAVRFPAYDWIFFAFPSGSSTDPDTYIAWDYARGYWHTIDYLPDDVTAGLLVEKSTGAYELLFGTSDGRILRAFSTYGAAGANITAKVRLRAHDFGTPDILKYCRGVDTVFLPSSSALNVTQRIYEGYADTGATAFWSKTLDIAGTNENAVNPEYLEPKDSNGDYPRAGAFVWECEAAGQLKWGVKILGLARQDCPQTIWRPGDPSA